MAAPVVNTLSPSGGLTVGGTFIDIDGSGFNLAGVGTVTVKFGGRYAAEVKVLSATRVICVTPWGDPGPVQVEVSNVTGALTETTTIIDGFTYARPDLSTRPNLSTHSEVAIITRTLVSEFRRAVLSNTHHDMHPEYADLESAADAQETQATAPNIRITGPDISDDPFYAHRGRIQDAIPGGFTEYHEPLSVMLTYQCIGVGRTPSEAANLWTEIARYFKMTPMLRVYRNGVDDTDGSIEFEMMTVPEDRARFRSEATRQATYQFSGSFQVRGVLVATSQSGFGVELDYDPAVNTEAL